MTEAYNSESAIWACDEPIGREPFGPELTADGLRGERLPSACSGPYPVEVSQTGSALFNA